MAATAIWLLTVLSAQEGASAAIGVGVLMLAAVVTLLWLRRRHPGVAGVSLCAASRSWWRWPSPCRRCCRRRRPGPPSPATAAYWRPFDRAAIAGLVGQGKTVFVDVTADWCLTCQANKRLVLSRESVADRLNAPGVVAMVADWTRPNDAIAAYLASFGRYGIPFNVVYGPRAPEGLPLPELLTEAAVLGALDRAGGATAGGAETAKR